MFCPSAHSLFLRSNGNLVCWDDYGSLKELQAYDPALDYARDVVLGSSFGGIREALKSGEMPFPTHCTKCHCLEAHSRLDPTRYAKERSIGTFQIEPSMGCQLDCPGCIPKSERKDRLPRTPAGHMTLDPDILFKIVDDLHSAGFSVAKFDMQGHGEPTLHKRVWEMIRYIADRFDASVITMCTHANAEFDARMVRSGINEILFAIDGVDQNSYRPYRIHGDFDRAYKFMRDFSLCAAEEAPHIDRVWKYVVFDHNDSRDQLLRAQEMAIAAKVSSLRFVLTQLGPASERIHSEEDIPVLDPALKITVDRYQITIDQLVAGLTEMKAALEMGDKERSERWADYFASSSYRLFKSFSKIPLEFQDVFDEFDRVISSHSAEVFGKHFAVRKRVGVSHTLINSDERVYSGRSNHGQLPPRASILSTRRYREVIHNVIVDEDWYAATYPMVRPHVQDKTYGSYAAHYKEVGFLEHRLPFRPALDESWYLNRYPDVARAVEAGSIRSGLDHFIHHGYREGRKHRPNS